MLRENYYIPTFNKYQGRICGGVEVHILDYNNYNSVSVAMHMIKAYLNAAKDGSVTVSSSIDRMFGIVGFYQMIQTREVEDILRDCRDERELYE